MVIAFDIFIKVWNVISVVSLLSRFKETIVYVWLEHYCYNLWLLCVSVWFKFNFPFFHLFYFLINIINIQTRNIYLEHTWLWIFIKLNSFFFVVLKMVFLLYIFIFYNHTYIYVLFGEWRIINHRQINLLLWQHYY